MRTLFIITTVATLAACNQADDLPPVINVNIDVIMPEQEVDEPVDTAEPEEELIYVCSDLYPEPFYIGEEGERHAFVELAHYFTYEDSLIPVVHITDAEMEAIPLGVRMPVQPRTVLVKITSDTDVFWVEPTADPYVAELRWIQTEALAVEMIGPNWPDYIIDLPDAVFVDYLIGPPIENATDVPVDVSQMKTRDDLWPYD